jgi:hypothetical protein
MKKYMLVIMMLCILSLSAVVHALSKNQVALGGIPLDAPLTYVNSIYGPPTRIDGGGQWVSHYGNGFLVYSSPRTTGRDSRYKKAVNYVDEIRVTQNNGISTPDGAYVAMKEISIEKLYGKPFNKFSNKDGLITYWYFADTQLLAFEVKNGLVISIRITETD